jgi:hypothetical protein
MSIWLYSFYCFIDFYFSSIDVSLFMIMIMMISFLCHEQMHVDFFNLFWWFYCVLFVDIHFIRIQLFSFMLYVFCESSQWVLVKDSNDYFMYLFLFIEHAGRLCEHVVRHTCISAECGVMVRRARMSHPRDLNNMKCFINHIFVCFSNTACC